MSLEAALAENTAALQALAAVQTRVADNQERLLVGQQAAIDKIEAGKGATAAERKPRAAAAKDTAPAAAEPAAAVEPAAPAERVVADDDIKAAALKWMDGKSKEEKEAAAKFLGEILAYFGTGGKLTGPDSKLDADQRKQTLFFIQRKAAGLEVNFSADYDFDGPTDQGVEAAAEDPLG